LLSCSVLVSASEVTTLWRYTNLFIIIIIIIILFTCVDSRVCSRVIAQINDNDGDVEDVIITKILDKVQLSVQPTGATDEIT